MRITNEVWSMTGKDCETMATELLIDANDLDRPEKRYQRMLRQAIELKDRPRTWLHGC